MKQRLKRLESRLRELLYRFFSFITKQKPVSLQDLRQHPPRSICLIRLDGVGDVVFSLASIQAFHTLYPEAKLSVVVYPHSKTLVSGLPGVETVHLFQKKNWGSVLKLFWKIRKNPCDWSVHLTHTTSLTAGLLARWAGQISISFEKPKGEIFHDILIPTKASHHLQKQEDLLKALGYPNSLNLVPLATTQADRQEIEPLVRQKQQNPGKFWIGLYLGNGLKGIDRRWSIEKYAALARRLSKSLPCQILALWGPEDRHLLEDFQRLIADVTPLPLIAPPTTLLQMAALMKELDVVVGVPTGPTHIATAMGTPFVALCRDFVYEGWRPLDSKHRVVRSFSDNVDDISEEAVYEKIHQLLSVAVM